MTRATWDLKVPGESLGAVDNSRHWNFSIWSTNKGVMAILVEGYNHKKCWKLSFSEKTTFLKDFTVIKMAITPMFFEQIEKFQCLTLSTTQGLSTGTLRLHMATCHVPENVSQSFSTLTQNNSKNPNYLI